MKTFFNLVQEVLKPGVCSGCGGCAVFCSAAGYRALEMDKNGNPAYRNMENCIQCGLCHSICPAVRELDDEIKGRAVWSEPMGRVIEANVVRSADPAQRNRSEDSGVMAALLVHLFDRQQIDGAVISRPGGPFPLRPFLASTREDILALSRICHDTPHGVEGEDGPYREFPGIEPFDPRRGKRLKRVALVGTPCQINSLRKMQVLNLVPSDAVKYCFGFFCSQSEKGLKDLAGKGAVKFSACRFCGDYSAEFADISFGKTGGGWTTVLSRTLEGKDVLADGLGANRIEQFDIKDNPAFATQALKAVRKASSAEKKTARYNRRNLKSLPVRVNI